MSFGQVMYVYQVFIGWVFEGLDVWYQVLVRGFYVCVVGNWV